MFKNRLGFGFLIIWFVLLLIYSGNFFFLGADIVLIATIVLVGVFIYRDAGGISVSVNARSGGREGRTLQVAIVVDNAKALRAAQSIYVEMEIENIMLGTKKDKCYKLMLTDYDREYDISEDATMCGEKRFSIKKAYVYDLFHLWKLPIKLGTDAYTVVFPRMMDVNLVVSGRTMGANNDEGMAQNRKGNDHSEMFDLKDYMPGDDVRSIHWKLSCKAENLIIRESSNPSHYSIVMLPDYGMNVFEKYPENAIKYINTVIAAANSIGEELLKAGIFFCMAIPTDNGLELYEVQSCKDWLEVMAQWMSIPMQSHSGDGVWYFKTEHMQQYFTKMIVLSAGNYEQNLQGMENDLGVMLIEATDAAEYEYRQVSLGVENIVLPAAADNAESYRIFC